MKTIKHLIINEDGLLGKNANIFVNKCSNFKSSITVSYAYKTVNAKSILAVLYLRATPYSFIEITISANIVNNLKRIDLNYLQY